MNKYVNKEVKTTCPYCGVGCGVLATLNDNGAVTVQGDPEHPANRGSLCSKGSALGETVYLQDRLLYPEIKGQQVSWEQAFATVAGRFSEIIEEHGPDAVAFYVSGQLLTEDYYVANKLMKGFIGSANIDTNSRLCMSSAVAAHKRAFGEDCVPCSYEDLDKANLIVLTGSNTAWCHPILFQRIVSAKKANPNLTVVTIDPRETQTTSIADLHLPLKPGSDAMLFNGLLHYLHQNDSSNPLFTEHHTEGLEAALNIAEKTAESTQWVAEFCGLKETDLIDFYKKFSDTEKTVTVFSQGINQSSSGVDKGNAIINCHLFTGRIGRSGMGPFSITGQPNAMGGREVGGLANQLAAHMDIDNPEHCDRVQRFWESPVIANEAGYKAVDLFNAVETGKVKAVWIMATNPVVSMPNAEQVKSALEKCELVVVSDCVRETDTAKVADILLPALTWGERDGTVTNSDRTISRQRPFLSAPGQAKADWDIITEVAHLMGYGSAFPYRQAADIFREHAALSGFENEQKRLFDISAYQNLSDDEYNQLTPTAWPIQKDTLKGTKQLFGNGQFSTPNRKARFIPIIPQVPVAVVDKQYPLILNTGRIRDHWHTMTRTGVSPRLSSHIFEPFVEIHPKDGIQYQVNDGALAKVTGTNQKELILRVKFSDKQQRGQLFIPIHWSEQFSSTAKVCSLIPAITDPISGQPELKHGIANIQAYKSEWHGFVLSTKSNRLQLDFAEYWVRSRDKGLWRFELSGTEQPANWSAFAHKLLDKRHKQESSSGENWIEYFDTAKNEYRAAQFQGERLINCIFIGRNEKLPQRDWLISLFQKDEISQSERMSILTGKPPKDQEDTGKVVCSCFNVGEKSILNAIKNKGCDTTEKIGECLNAGTNCGSCLPELRELIALEPVS